MTLDLPGYATHTVAFVCGAVTWWAITRWEGRQILAQQRRDMPEPARQKRPTLGAVVLIILLAAAVIIAIGFQQAWYQREADDRDTCYETWGRDVVKAAHASRGAARQERTAEKRRDQAVDRILEVVVGFRSIPPSSTERDLDRSLARWQNARGRLLEVSSQAQQTREENPWPRLDCR